MSENFTYLEWVEQSESSKEKMPCNSKLRHVILTWAAVISTFLMTSCDSLSSDPVKQQERIARHEQEVKDVSYKLDIKIEARKPLVQEYNRLLVQCEAEPDNASLKKYTRLMEKKIIKCNKEIESLAEEKLNKTIRLDDDRSKSQNWMGTWRSLTDANYFDYLIQWKDQKWGEQNCGANTANNIVTENWNGWENWNNSGSNSERWQSGVTLEEGVKN